MKRVLSFLLMIERLAIFINSLNRNVWAGVFALFAVIVAMATIKDHALLPIVSALLTLAGAAFNGKE